MMLFVLAVVVLVSLVAAQTDEKYSQPFAPSREMESGKFFTHRNCSILFLLLISILFYGYFFHFFFFVKNI